MTIRSIILGLAGAAGICAITYFNNRVLHGTQLIGNNLPVAVYGILIIGVLVINPLLRRFALTGKEIAVVLALTLAACTIPGSGLLHTFPGVLVLPYHQQQKQAGWQGEPAVVDIGDVKNWGGLKAALAGPGPVSAKLSDELRATLSKPGDLSDAERSQLLAALNGLIYERKLLEPSIRELSLPSHVKRLAAKDHAKLTQVHAEYLGRAVLDVYLADHLVPRRPSITEQAPPHMLADVTEDETVLNGFVLGLGQNGSISLSDIPWRAWGRTFMFWIPLILTMWGAFVALSLLLHRQWSQHEHLPYPITTFADSILPQHGGVAKVFQHRSFWWAMGIVLVLYLNNYAAQAFPDHMVKISNQLNFRSLADLIPLFVKGGGNRYPSLLAPRIYFIAIGIAFFIPKDVSFSLGIGPFLWTIVAGALAFYGFEVSAPLEASAGEWMGVTPRVFMIFGAVLGIFLTIIYTGRQYYKAVILRSFGLKSVEQVGPTEIWAGRSFIMLALLLIMQIAILARAGFLAAALYVAVIFIAAVVTARIIAETGLFHIQIMLFPCAILWGLLGLSGLGSKTLMILQLITMVMLIDPRESLMPFMANSLKLLEKRSVKLGKPVLWCVAALVIGLGVGLLATMYLQYKGGLAGSSWEESYVPSIPFKNAISTQRRIEARGLAQGAELAEETPGVQLGKISPEKTCLVMMLVSAGVVLICMAARIRWRWWPIHPLLFVIWSSGHMRYFAGAFLIGWLIKVVVTKYGGSSVYEKLKPLMIGLMAGEIFGAVVPCILSLVCWLVTGEAPQRFDVLPN